VPEQSRRTVVVDTSVLVADPGSLFCFVGEDLVIPLTVVEELDGQKTRRDDVGAAAREALRSIEKLRIDHAGDIQTAIDLSHGGTVRVETNGVHLDVIRAIGLDDTKPDNRILAACCGLRANGADVRVLTNDTAMRIKAAQLGFPASEHVRRRSDVDENANGQWPTLEVSASLVQALFRGKREMTFAELDLADRAVADIPVNSFAVLRAGSASVLARSSGKHVAALPQSRQAYGLTPRSKEQHGALELLLDPSVAIVALDGSAGTGKTVLALAAGLEQVVEKPRLYQRVAVYRPIIPVGRADVGFLPGSLEEKLEPWMAAILDAMAALTEDGSYLAARNVVEELTYRGVLTMETVSFLRGRTLQSSFIVVDEAQNLELTTVRTILTRVGEGAKIVFCGDRDQIDAPYLSKHNNGLAVLLDAFRGHRCFGGIQLATCERSEVAALAASLL
jgi:PhoH-like ATPase